MYVLERGTGSPIVLVHGFAVDHRLLLPCDEVIAADGAWRRLYLDLPAHGRTPIGSVDGASAVVAAVEEEIAARIGDEPFALVGSSFGGLVARQVAHDLGDRVTGLALIAPVVHSAAAERDLPPRTVLASDHHLIASLGEAGRAFAEMSVVQTRAAADAFVEFAWPGLCSGDAVGQGVIEADYALPVPPESGGASFDLPTLIVTGRQDHVVGYRDQLGLLDHYPRATYAVLDGAGHNVHLDRPEAVGALLADWLALVREVNEC